MKTDEEAEQKKPAHTIEIKTTATAIAKVSTSMTKKGKTEIELRALNRVKNEITSTEQDWERDRQLNVNDTAK